MYVLDRPLIPKYTRAKLTSDTVSPLSTTTSRSSSGVSSQLNASGRSFNFSNDDDDFDHDNTLSGPTPRSTATASAAPAPSSTVTTRVLSSTSLQSGRPYSTTDGERRPSVASNASRRAAVTASGPATSWAKKQLMMQKAKKKTKGTTTASGESANSRQWSADSGIEEVEDSMDAKFILPPRITTYVE